MFRDCPELLWSLYFLSRHVVGFLFGPFAFVRTFLVVLRCGIFVPLPLPLVSVSVLLLLRVSLPGVHLFPCVMLPFLYYLCFLSVSRVYVWCRLVCMLLYLLPFCGMVFDFALLSFCRFAEVFFDSFSFVLSLLYSHVSFFLSFSRSNTGFVVFQLFKCIVFIEFPKITERSKVFHPLFAKKRELFVVSVLPVWAFIYPVCHYTLVFSRSPYRVFQYTPALALFVCCSSGHIPSPKYSPFAVLLCFYFVGFLCGFRLVLVFCVLAYP